MSEQQEQLDRIEAKLDGLLAKIERYEAMAVSVAPIVAQHPVVKNLARSLGM